MNLSRYAWAVVFAAGIGIGAHGEQAPPAQAPQPKTAVQPQSGQPSTQQKQPAQQQQPTFRAGVNLVRVDVIITDRKGAPVTDLKAEDFAVSEDGRPQKVDSFKLIRIEDKENPGDVAPREIRNEDDERYETSREDVRLVVFLLDDYHVRIDSGMRVRGPLRKFMTTQVGPNDLFAIMYPLTPVSALRFTHDRFDLAADVDKFEGRSGNYMVRNDAEGRYVGAPPEVIEAIRTQVTLSALEGLVTHLGSLREGRKSVVLVSEGFPLAWDEMKELQHVFEAANRNNTAIYTLDPRGLTTNPYDEYTKDTLRILADNTDGRALVSRNDFSEGLQTVMRDASAYYLIGYGSDAPPDGKFHEIKVRVKRPGVDVRARKGYWAPSAAEAAKASAPPRPEAPAAVTKALSAIARPPGGRAIRTWLGMSRGENGKTRVTFVWEPAARAADGTSTAQPARVTIVASGPKGEAYYNGPVAETAAPGAQNETPPAKPPASAATPAPARATFDAVPGKVQIKLTVEDASGEVIEADARDFDVPDLTGGQIALATPAVFRARTPRELRAIASEATAVPTPDRQFSRTERLLVRVEAYGPGAPAFSARLLNRAGAEMTSLPVQPGTDPSRASLELPLVSVAPGEYLIEVKAKSQSGEATEVIAIRVTS